MNDPNAIRAYQRAWRKVAARNHFWSHVTLFVIAAALLTGIWRDTNGGRWLAWTLGVWGTLLLGHAVWFFGFWPVAEARLEAQIEEQIRSDARREAGEHSRFAAFSEPRR